MFADILLVPMALGQKLGFGEDGPRLEPIADSGDAARLRADGITLGLEPVCETIRRCRAALPEETALIGFAGSPWTVATYMVEGGGSRDFLRVKSWAYRDPEGFQSLVDILTEATSAYLAMQIAAANLKRMEADLRLPAPDLAQDQDSLVEAMLARLRLGNAPSDFRREPQPSDSSDVEFPPPETSRSRRIRSVSPVCRFSNFRTLSMIAPSANTIPQTALLICSEAIVVNR